MKKCNAKWHTYFIYSFFQLSYAKMASVPPAERYCQPSEDFAQKYELCFVNFFNEL